MTGRHILFEIPGVEVVEVALGSADDPVVAIWISHHCETLLLLDQSVDQGLGGLEVNIRVAGTVDEEEVSF